MAEPPSKNAGPVEESTLNEDGAKAAEIAALEAKKKADEEAASWRPDGTKHKDGVRHFPDGSVVGGVNLYWTLEGNSIIIMAFLTLMTLSLEKIILMIILT